MGRNNWAGGAEAAKITPGFGHRLTCPMGFIGLADLQAAHGNDLLLMVRIDNRMADRPHPDVFQT